MRIVSQNRKISVNFDSVSVVVMDDIVYCAFENPMKAQRVVLGHYATEQRAQEVFGEMNRESATTYYRADNPVPNKVYYMPEE